PAPRSNISTFSRFVAADAATPPDPPTLTRRSSQGSPEQQKMDPMRRFFAILIAVGFRGALSGCGSCIHGKWDCVDCHGPGGAQPVDGPHTAGPEWNH